MRFPLKSNEAVTQQYLVHGLSSSGISFDIVKLHQKPEISAHPKRVITTRVISTLTGTDLKRVFETRLEISVLNSR